MVDRHDGRLRARGTARHGNERLSLDPTNAVTAPAPDRLLEYAATGDVAGAFALLEELLEDGWPAARVLAEVVVPAQQEVGRRWQRNEWTVAKEHTATAVVDAIVGVLGLRASRAVRERPSGDPVLVVCAEGEWHTLMARLVAEGLRAEGWPVHLLGGSVPATHLGQAVEEGDWAAAIVCCAVPMFLHGARRSIAAVRAAGVPVLATGRGFGTDSRRASRLGADAWAADLSAGLVVLSAWEQRRPSLPGAPAVPDEVAELSAAAPGLVDLACHELAQVWPPFAALDASARERTREDFGYLLRFLEAALLTDDERVLVEYVDWLEIVLSSRGVPVDVIPLTLRCVQRVLPTSFRGAHDALLQVTARLDA